MVAGLALIVTVGAGMVTVIVTLAVAVPPGPAAVIVYGVVSAGVTMLVPDGFTEPIPWSIVTESALVELHVSVEDSPT